MTQAPADSTAPLTTHGAAHPIVGFAGMTHLGLVSAVACAAKGFPTICFDADASRVSSIARGNLPVEEPDLADLLASNVGRLTFTADTADLERCDIVYISIDVPTDDCGLSDLQPVRALLERVLKAMRDDAVLVVLCQVPPGFTRSIRRSGSGPIYYQVETLIFGRAVERASSPERFIVGCADPASPLDARFERLLARYECPILPMRYESAELAKISINFCLVASIGVANTLAEVSEKVGADWAEIVPALKLDRRIGPWSYLAPGLGIAGGNLERDLRTVVDLSQRFDTDSGIVKAWIANSQHRKAWAIERVRTVLAGRSGRPRVAVWGLAYKENTHSTKNSPSIFTIEALSDMSIVAHDPVVPIDSVKHADIKSASDPVEAARDADVLMILTPWPAYRQIAAKAVAAVLRGKIVIDPYRVLPMDDVRDAGLEHHMLGRSLPGSKGNN